MQDVTILGADLDSHKNQSKGVFHVHAAECADIKRNYTARDCSHMYTATFLSKTDVVEWAWEDILNDAEDRIAELSGCFTETYFAPCVHLPLTFALTAEEVK